MTYNRITLLVGLVGFAYFAGSALALASIGADTSLTPAAHLMRLVLAFVLAAALAMMERRRPNRSAFEAFSDGLLYAAIVVVADNLTGPSYGGAELALRTAIVVVGLPSLALLTHAFSRRFGTTARTSAG